MKIHLNTVSSLPMFLIASKGATEEVLPRQAASSAVGECRVRGSIHMSTRRRLWECLGGTKQR